MKNILLGIAVLLSVVSFSYAAAIYQPLRLGSVLIGVSSGTATDIQVSTAATVGEARWCWNCGANGGVGTVCFSTGTANGGQFILSTGTRCQ